MKYLLILLLTINSLFAVPEHRCNQFLIKADKYMVKADNGGKFYNMDATKLYLEQSRIYMKRYQICIDSKGGKYYKRKTPTARNTPD